MKSKKTAMPFPLQNEILRHTYDTPASIAREVGKEIFSILKIPPKGKVEIGKKRHMVGFETEMLILEENGAISSRADELLQRASDAKLKFPLHTEYTHNMIEIASVANVRVRRGAHEWLETVGELMRIARSLELRIYPYATYFGTHTPTIREARAYRMQEIIKGEGWMHNVEAKIAGFHFHYCLPYGTFNRESRSLRTLVRSKYKEQLLNIHNMIIAADPALTNFMESSPFVDGRYMAKDSRVLLYRALNKGKDAVRGLYHDMPIFGALPRYANGVSDLIMLCEERHEKWGELVGEKCPEYMDVFEAEHPLKFNWSPLRINKVGTFEYRGLDMNLPSYMIGSSVLLKYLLKMVRHENLTVKPSDIGIKNPFKREGDVVYVPPHTYLARELQYRSAVDGLTDDAVYKYAKGMIALAMKAVPDKNDPGLARIRKVIEERKTKSDEILERVKNDGHDLNGKLEEEYARNLALHACDDFESEVHRMISRELAIDLEE